MTRVAVAAPHPLAVHAGEDVAARGGNAVDAAVAAAMTLTVAYPHMTGVAGDLFALVRRPDGSTVSINASGAVPQQSDVRYVRMFAIGHPPSAGFIARSAI